MAFGYSRLIEKMEDISTPEIDLEKADSGFGNTVVYSGLVVGVLDGTAAVVNSALRGVTPDRVFQYIASGVLGRSAFEGGAVPIALGVLLHFVVALGAATAFFFASRFLPILTRRPFIFGPLYGIAVFFFMREVISPLSLVSRIPATVSVMITGILIHILFVGLPIALIQKRLER